MNNSLDKIKHVLEKNRLVIFGYLFGSRAKNLAGVKSDWDIAIYFDAKAIKDWSRFWLEAEIEKEIKESVQVTVLNVIEDPVFAFEIIREGMVIIDRNPEIRILFENSILRQYHDWNYFLDRHIKITAG